ncbi:MAG: RNA-guided pseudouridylation complex pseudouridine synthase subunit Cbf5 [Candidatus Methanofastidiosia archaeon]
MIAKCKFKTSEKYGKPPSERTIEELLNCGIINLDKPKGPTSHEVVSFVKKILNVKKAGHSGTLDPKVTGVLPVATQRATKILQALLTGSKEYICVMHLHKKVPLKSVLRVLKEFQGVLYQRPPLKSAVRRTLRTREIYELEVLEIQENDVLMRVNCQAGTYIRKLCYDIGLVLKVGANMEELRRTRASHFREEGSVRLSDLLDAYIFWSEEGEERYLRECILPGEVGVLNLKKLWLQDSSVDAICHGAELAIPGVAALDDEIVEGEILALMTLKDELVALCSAKMSSRQILKARRGVVAKTESVIMKRGTYPKSW